MNLRPASLPGSRLKIRLDNRPNICLNTLLFQPTSPSEETS